MSWMVGFYLNHWKTKLKMESFGSFFHDEESYVYDQDIDFWVDSKGRTYAYSLDHKPIFDEVTLLGFVSIPCGDGLFLCLQIANPVTGKLNVSRLPSR